LLNTGNDDNKLNTNIEETLEDLKKEDYIIPEKFDYQEAKKYFMNSTHIDITSDDLNADNPPSRPADIALCASAAPNPLAIAAAANIAA
jgi:hypothetical protein